MFFSTQGTSVQYGARDPVSKPQQQQCAHYCKQTMASLVSKLIYQDCLLQWLEVKLSLEIRDREKYINFSRSSRTPRPPVSAGPLRRNHAGRKSSPWDTQRQEEWWERKRRQLESQASLTLCSYSDVLRTNNTPMIPHENLSCRQKLDIVNPVPTPPSPKGVKLGLPKPSPAVHLQPKPVPQLYPRCKIFSAHPQPVPQIHCGKPTGSTPSIKSAQTTENRGGASLEASAC